MSALSANSCRKDRSRRENWDALCRGALVMSLQADNGNKLEGLQARASVLVAPLLATSLVQSYVTVQSYSILVLR